MIVAVAVASQRPLEPRGEGGGAGTRGWWGRGRGGREGS